MSEPKVTLEQILKRERERPTSPEFDLALVEFLDKSDSEQKAILFRTVCDMAASVNWLLAQARK